MGELRYLPEKAQMQQKPMLVKFLASALVVGFLTFSYQSSVFAAQSNTASSAKPIVEKGKKAKAAKKTKKEKNGDKNINNKIPVGRSENGKNCASEEQIKKLTESVRQLKEKLKELQ